MTERAHSFVLAVLITRFTAEISDFFLAILPCLPKRPRHHLRRATGHKIPAANDIYWRKKLREIVMEQQASNIR